MATKKQYDYVTSEIIKALESDKVPWQQPWKNPANLSAHHNGFDGRVYSGATPFTLWAVAARKGCGSNVWLSYKQAKKLGGYVADKGAAPVYFWKILERQEKDPDTNELVIRKIPIINIYQVFNLEQTKDVKLPKRETVKPKRAKKFNPIKEAQAIIDNFLAGADAPSYDHNGGGSAFYRPTGHAVSLPKQELFITPAEYYSTSFHELGHSTGHSSMLNRFDNETKLAPFGSEDYSKEELIAEFTSAFLCHQAGIDSTRKNSVAYIKNWLKVLKNDPKLALTAAGKAQTASNIILKAPTGAVEAPVG